MNTVIILIGLFVMPGCQQKKQNVAEVTFQIDGHHLVINYFILGDQIVMTPTFMGSEPNYIADGENAGIRTFENEEKPGLKLYNSLDDANRYK